MKWLFLMDPLESVKPQKDTTYAIMCEAYDRGHEVYYLPKGGISLHGELIWFRVVHVIPQKSQTEPFIIGEASLLSQDQVNAIFIRTDPPFDQDYLMHTWLLDRLPENILVMNSANGIRTVNEKLWATQFTTLIPPTAVTRHVEDFRSFLEMHQTVIAKPTDGFGGAGVFFVRQDETNANVIFETLSAGRTKEVILQKYIPAAKIGDKRILLLNGNPLGAVLRVHSDSDHRNNFFAGGHPAPAEITPRDHEIINTLRPHLQALGLYFVGIDVIGDYLIEVNVTSPTCLQEMNRIYKQNLATPIVEFVEAKIGRSSE